MRDGQQLPPHWHVPSPEVEAEATALLAETRALEASLALLEERLKGVAYGADTRHAQVPGRARSLGDFAREAWLDAGSLKKHVGFLRSACEQITRRAEEARFG